MIFHLAAIVSGEAEQDFDKGYRINMDGTRGLLEAVRHAGHKPRLVFASSIAVFGAPFPEAIGDEFFNTPLTSYGTQKNICELLVSDYTPQGLPRRHQHSPAHHLRAAGQAQQGGVGLLLQHHARAAGGPGGGAAGVGERDALARLAARRGRLHACMPRPSTPPRSGRAARITMPGLAVTVGEQIAALKKVAGDKVVARIRREPDPFIEQIVAGWPRKFAAKRALALGFKPDASFEEIIRIHIEDELGGRVA